MTRHHPAATAVPFAFYLVAAIGVFLLAWMGIWLTRESGRVASIWFANAFLLVLIVDKARGVMLGAGAAALLANVLANMASGDALEIALGLALCNSIEVFIAAILISHFAPQLQFGRLKDQSIFVLFAGLGSPIISSALAAFLLFMLRGMDPAIIFFAWYPADALGMIIVFPLLWSLRDLDLRSEFLAVARPTVLSLLALTLIATAVVFSQTRYPLLFAVLPPLVLVSFTSGFLGAAIALTGVAAVSIALTLAQTGPILFVDGSLQERVFFLQSFLAVCVALSLPVAAVVAERRRMYADLKDANAKINKANAAKTEFLATMSHEIRTPLNSITGFTQIILANGDVSLPVRRQLGLIQQASSALLTIVDDVLDFSKIEAGRLSLSQSPFALLSLVDSCCSIIRAQAEAKELPVRLEVAPDLPRMVIGDEARARQVLLNLLGNAVKFTESGFVKLSVRRGENPERSHTIVFVVQDTGIGIPADRLDQLFESFIQLDTRTARQYGGSGLGLAISRRIADQMGGSVTVQSKVGTGSTFTFTADLPDAGIEPVDTQVEELLDTAVTPASLLLVEDLIINQEIVVALLTPFGHSVHVVSSGNEALAAVKEQRFDAILMDIQMPGMDGVETTSRIRAMPGAVAHTPIIALTANVIVEETARFKRAGMNDHVGKPFDRSTLLDAIDRAIKGASSDKGLITAPGPSPELSQLTSLMGAERVESLLTRLRSQLLEMGAANDVELSAEEALAHKLVSSAGMLGFTELSSAARHLELSIRADDDLISARQRFQSVRASVLAELSEEPGRHVPRASGDGR